MTQLISFRVILVWVLYEEDEDVDEEFVWDSVYGVFPGFKRSETRPDRVNLGLGIVEEGEEMGFLALGGLEPFAKSVECTISFLSVGH